MFKVDHILYYMPYRYHKDKINPIVPNTYIEKISNTNAVLKVSKQEEDKNIFLLKICKNLPYL